MTVEAVGSGDVAQLHNSTIPEPEEKDDLRGDILAAIEKLKGDESETVAEVAQDAEGSPSSSPQRARDPATGQFIKADGTVDPDQSPEPVTDVVQTQGNQPEQSSAQEAPKGLSADIRAKWATLDPSIQAEFVRRDQAADNGAKQWIEKEQVYQQQLAPLNEFAQRYQIDNGTALTRLLDWQRALEQNPREAIMQLAQLSGILDNPNQTQQQSQPVPYDPRLDSVLPIVTDLQQNFINTQIEAFKASPGHEHFDTVRVQMGQMMEANPKLSMQDAYDQSIWLNPDVRESLISARVTPLQQQQAQQAQVAKARAAATPKGSGPLGNAPKPKQEYDTVREAVLASAREHGWAV